MQKHKKKSAVKENAAKHSGKLVHKGKGGILQSLKDSFTSIDRRFILVMLLDAVFLAMSYLSLVVWNDLIRNRADAMDVFFIILKQANGNMLSGFEKASLTNFIVFCVLATILMLCFLSFFWTIARNMSWNIILKRPLFEDNAVQSLLFGFLWFVMWATTFIAAFYLLRNVNYMIFLMIIFFLIMKMVYFNIISDISYHKNKKQTVLQLFKSTFVTGYTRFKDLMLPYAIVAVAVIIFLLLLFQLPHDELNFEIVMLFVAIITFTTWARYYFWNAFHSRYE